MPRNERIKKVMVIGSGPIIIGQAAEFDYAGTQACRALREEGVEVVLVNSNPATIMTDEDIADKVYLEPLNAEVLKNIIRVEKPDSILPTLGGQTGLNLAVELAESGFLDEVGVRLLGTTVDSIRRAEDREAFKETMEEIGEPIIDSVIVTDADAALDFAAEVGYPVIVRPAYTLGGTGGGIAADPPELFQICSDGLRFSRVHQCLIEKSVAGWKEVEYEVVRDGKGNCITVCNMENIDPVGIHTGDSIVVAPSQTLRDAEYQMLRSASINIINALKIEGGCNVQYALDPDSMRYYVIEVNPRVSRSSALASKATGYPIAKVSAKIAIGYGLDEIRNAVTGKTFACFEPTLDYVVVKFPRWPFDKFTRAEKTLGTRMKATGEVMSIGANFEAAFLKAVRSLELGMNSLEFKSAAKYNDQEIRELLHFQSDERIYVVTEALRRGISAQDIFDITRIDQWYLHKLENVVQQEERVKKEGFACLSAAYLRKLKKMGFADAALARWTGKKETDIRALRREWSILPTYKMVDTCGAEFDAVSPYYYSTYDDENEARKSGNKTVVVLGSGPIRIGQGVEFDYCSVHSIWALKKAGYDTVIINNNPETVSTDFDTSDRLYFEPLTPEDMWNVLEFEQPEGVVVQFGGQTAIKLAKSVQEAGFRILGTSLADINAAEDREEFDALLERLNVARPKGHTVFTAQQALDTANELGYPVLVRPSYVLGGQGMEIAWNDGDIREYMDIININVQEHPILVDKYLLGKEIEVDAICDGDDILIPGIMQHVERAGVHSGDSISVYPAYSISPRLHQEIIDCTMNLCRALHVIGMINIQFIIYNDALYIIEVNPRSSRTVPYISKVTGVPLIELATRAVLGLKLKDEGYHSGLVPSGNIYAVKVPVFSFEKLPKLEVSLGPEMKSTGEVLGIAPTYGEAVLKGLMAAGLNISKGGDVVISVADNDKQEAVRLAEDFAALGYRIYATAGTAHALNAMYVPASMLDGFDGEKGTNLLELLRQDKVKLIVNTATRGRDPERKGFKMRRAATEYKVPCLTSMDTAFALVQALKLGLSESEVTPMGLHQIRHGEK
ncbi:MAG: carbamoyl-phosphate synthase large subunit [Eubacteriales bacterium]|nr:carbamoyl-phosphate synthase large subunit [Eubacteriales bacterium]